MAVNLNISYVCWLKQEPFESEPRGSGLQCSHSCSSLLRTLAAPWSSVSPRTLPSAGPPGCCRRTTTERLSSPLNLALGIKHKAYINIAWCINMLCYWCTESHFYIIFKSFCLKNICWLVPDLTGGNIRRGSSGGWDRRFFLHLRDG